MTSLVASLLLFVAVGAGFIFVHLVAGKFIRPNKPGVEKGTIYECGEPTIGSAWIQFDLRFYVVALLFVIFDVEVAFFFPWAEVFGKANAIVAAGEVKDFDSIKDVSNRAYDLIPDNPGKANARALYRHLGQMNKAEYDKFVALVKTDLPTKFPVDPRTKAPYTPDDYLKHLSEEELKNSELATVSDRRPHLAVLALDSNQFESMRQRGTPFSKNSLEPASTLSMLALGEIVIFFGVILVGFAYLWRRGDLAWVRSLQAPQVQPVETLVTSAPESAPAVAKVEVVHAGAHH